MNIERQWVTPIAAGAFLLSAVTGVLIFFHLDSGLNKVAHEWLSWVLLGGVGLHVAANFGGLKRHLTSKRGAGLVGLFAVLLGLSFVVPAAPKKEPPFMASVQALSNAPISTLALVAKRSPQEVRATLAAEGFSAVSDEQSLGELAGPDMGKRMRLLRKVLAQAPKSAG